MWNRVHVLKDLKRYRFFCKVGKLRFHRKVEKQNNGIFIEELNKIQTIIKR